MDLKKLPTTAGVYLLKRRSAILYIGKALNVRDRVKTHLVARTTSPKTLQMRRQVDNVDFISVRSNFEALLLEINLIKKHLPPYNSSLKDDKDYLYLKITDEAFPRVLTVRKKDLEGSRFFLGPFPNATLVRSTIRSLRRLFPFCNEKIKQGKPCFYRHLGLCPGPCADQIDKRHYRQIIRRLTTFLGGKSAKVIQELQREMETLSKQKRFEEAAKVRDQLSGINYLAQENYSAEYMRRPDLAEDLLFRELEDLKTVLGLPSLPARIECYDISHTGGTYATGSMVVFQNGQADKSQYRRFRIRQVKGIDDYASHQEVLRRRFQHDWHSPDLVVIDGGLGQLHAAQKVFGEINLTTPIVALAKREEEIYTTSGAKLRLKRTAPALQLVQRLRDEAHRFAITYHRKLRSDALVGLNKR